MVISKRGLVLGTTAIVLSTVAVTGAGVHLSRGQAFFRESPKELIDEVWQIVNRQYVDADTLDKVDWQQVRQSYLERTYTDKEEAYTAVREMLELIDDPYTRFMDPEEFQNMKIDTSGQLTGVGITITKEEETDNIIVISPIEDTPAFEAGIQAKDIIVKIDGQSTEGMDTDDAVKLIRGQVGSQVTLTVEREGELIDFTITRDRIEIHPVKASLEQSSTGEIGYIRLTQFSAQASQEMREAIAEFEEQGVEGYILDLRSNPGGLLYASIDIARMWLEEGTIVSTVDRQGIQDVRKAKNGALTDKPLVVLIDGGSASASEILSGALQDNDRGTLVGSKTFGKGLVQSIRDLGDGSGLAVTIAKYLTPSGRDINEEGIYPDIEIELSEADRDRLIENRDLIGTNDDPQFAEAIDILDQKIQAQTESDPQANR